MLGAVGYDAAYEPAVVGLASLLYVPLCLLLASACRALIFRQLFF